MSSIVVVLPSHFWSIIVFCSSSLLFRWNNRRKSWICSSSFCEALFLGHQKRKNLEKMKYNASILPRRLILVRHGQSAGNVTENLYAEMADNSIPLTDLGWEQSKMAGIELKESIASDESSSSVHFIISPYVRTMETFHGIVSAWCDPQKFHHIADINERQQAWYTHLRDSHGITWHEDPRIREQDFGNYQDPIAIKACKEERAAFGPFYYRFPHGESSADVYDRVSTFKDSLWRSFETARSQNIILVTHGNAIRVFLARYFRCSIDQYHELDNPKNCEIFVLEHDGSGILRLGGRQELVESSSSSSSSSTVSSTVNNYTGYYKFYKDLRTLPEYVIKKKRRVVRLSPKE